MQVGCTLAADLEIGSDFLRSLDWSSSLCSEIIPTCVRRARQTCAICPLMMVLRHLNQGRDGGLHSNSSCFRSIELLFPNLAGDIANVTIAQIPLIPDPPPARNPPPAVIRQKGSACSVTRLLVIIVTTSIVQWSPVLCMSMQALAGWTHMVLKAPSL